MREMYQSHGWPQNFRSGEFTVARDAYIERIKEVSFLRGEDIMREQMRLHFLERQQHGDL